MSDCTVSKANLGLSQCNKLPGLPKTMIETPVNWAIPAATLASGSAAILTYLQNALLVAGQNRIFLYPPFASFENLSEQTVYQVNPLKYTFVRDGNYIFRYGVSENLCTHTRLFTHRSKNRRVFIIDAEGQMLGTTLSNGDFAGLSLNLLHTEKLTINDGSNASESKVLVAMSNNQELDLNGKLLDIADFYGELYRIVDVDLTIVGTPSSTSIVVDVKAECDGTPLSGLVKEDFVLTDDSDGSSLTISSATESATVPGRYTLAGTGFVDSHLNLVASASLSVKAYESTGSVAVNEP